MLDPIAEMIDVILHKINFKTVRTSTLIRHSFNIKIKYKKGG